MKKLKRLMVLCLAVTLIVIVSCKTHYDTTTTTGFTAVKTSTSFEHGRNLVYNICADCHYDKGTGKFTGMQMHDVPGIAGKVYSANLTNSPSHGLPPHYTDAQLQYLLKTGIAKDGRFLSYMLRPNMADDDINDIIVYLRSDDKAVAAADTTVGITHLNFIGKIGISFIGKPAPFKTGIKRPAESDAIATGRYLVDNIGCYHCHSKSFGSLNYINPEQSKNYLAGGMKFKDSQGVKRYASNITPDKQTGIGNYTKEQFRAAIKDGKAPDGELHIPMPRFHELTDEQADAIYAYLQTVPPVEHKVD